MSVPNAHTERCEHARPIAGERDRRIATELELPAAKERVHPIRAPRCREERRLDRRRQRVAIPAPNVRLVGRDLLGCCAWTIRATAARERLSFVMMLSPRVDRTDDVLLGLPKDEIPHSAVLASRLVLVKADVVDEHFVSHRWSVRRRSGCRSGRASSGRSAPPGSPPRTAHSGRQLRSRGSRR